MKISIRSKKHILIALLIALGVAGYAFIFGNDPVDYNTQVKPLINQKCISCHGGVKKKGGFSLLFRSEALDTTESGKPAIIPGNPDESEMIRRLTLEDADERMPYHEEPLSKDEISILRRWIREGARWGDHWAYETVREPKLPVEKSWLSGLFSKPEKIWARNEVDLYIEDKFNGLELEPSREAEKTILLRRLSLDLIGMPAPDNIAQKFLQRSDSAAYEQLVDDLMKDQGFGERWASMWMDLARYADTKGYERDDARSIWRYRDWLIRSFNEDKPYNVFLTEQLAGDLLPNASDEQLIATAFHRNTLTNDEGGTENEEFRISAVMDRVNTTWEVLMGTTFACVQCHAHPYDPFRHEEYYKFLAFFNNTRDEDSYADYPLLYEYKGKDSLKFLQVNHWLRKHASADQQMRIEQFLRTRQPAYNGLVTDSFVNAELADTKWLIMRNRSIARFQQVDLTGKSNLLFRFKTWPQNGRLRIHLDQPEGPVLLDAKLSGTRGKWTTLDLPLESYYGMHNLYFRYESPMLKSMNDNGVMFDWLYFNKPFPGKSQPGYDSAYAMFRQLIDQGDAVTTPILIENSPDMSRETRIFERGNWLVKGDQVRPGVPASLPSMEKGSPANRLGLAMWLTSPQNPLTSRTMINRIWEQLFGQGLAETLEDLGTQGIPPTHPELLDYLSWTFMHEDQWSLKKTLKRIVMSATYRQDSKVTKTQLEKDPYNKWYARGPRIRLSAEQVRDQALAFSGLLSKKMYGPSVMPYQPEGVWLSPWNGNSWTMSKGEDQYRRALYTYWKRSSPYPSMIHFDGPSREVCSARRIRTNTPLQALTILNDSAYVDIARRFALKLIKDNGKDYPKMIGLAYELATGRPVDPAKKIKLEKLYALALDRFLVQRDGAKEMLGGDNAPDAPEAAALVVVTNAILNLDEVITKY